MSDAGKKFQSEMMRKYREDYRDDISAISFFGEPIDDASREELLGLIGWLVNERKRAKTMLDSERRVWSALSR